MHPTTSSWLAPVRHASQLAGLLRLFCPANMHYAVSISAARSMELLLREMEEALLLRDSYN